MTDRDDDLDALFDAARTTGADPSEAFLARLQADADAALASARVVPFAPRPARVRAWGGGLLAAGLAGIAIGLAAPDTLNTLLLTTSDDFLLAEVLPSANPALLFGEVQ